MGPVSHHLRSLNRRPMFQGVESSAEKALGRRAPGLCSRSACVSLKCLQELVSTQARSFLTWAKHGAARTRNSSLEKSLLPLSLRLPLPSVWPAGNLSFRGGLRWGGVGRGGVGRLPPWGRGSNPGDQACGLVLYCCALRGSPARSELSSLCRKS